MLLEISGGASIKMAGLDFEDHATGFALNLASGFTLDIRDNIQLYGDISHEGDFEHYKTTSSNLGLRISW